MKLYYAPGACSLAPHIAFCEAGIKFQAEKVDLKTKKYAGGDFKKINPKGVVPTIEMDNGEILTEGAAILQYIAHHRPEANLMPKPGSAEHCHAQEWLNFCATEIHKGYGLMFHAEKLVANKEGQQQLMAGAKESLCTKLNFVSERLAKQNFFLNQYSVVDIYMYTCLRWSGHVGVELSKWAPINKFMERMASRPKVQEALNAEGLK